ncbi:hypothetical protein I5677_00890 [Mobilitalea sibirica]|uniref:Uncharacterized protein n=1 Tax=Mobilitalea sibirica TaxID=1462919 RepID=A0A8J7GWX1_9FIRM|nr:DUF6106 family protein [Mobilitalea sibirica]MBH1939444.1 hypothetical protein [Mobilitalea sibirica]
MNQLYAEAGVKRKDTTATLALRFLMFVGIIIGFIAMFLGQIFSIVGIAMVVVLFYLLPRLNVEYEYVFVDGQLDFDKIMGKAKRKQILRIDFEQVEIMAPINSHALDSYNHVQMDKKDFSSGTKESKPYVIIANVDNKKYRILFEPSEKMIGMIKQKSPRKLSPY